MPAQDWLVWALLSAEFAALTAIFAKVGLAGIDSDFATLMRTVVIVFVLAFFVALAGKLRDPRTLSAKAVGLRLAGHRAGRGRGYRHQLEPLTAPERQRSCPVGNSPVTSVGARGV